MSTSKSHVAVHLRLALWSDLTRFLLVQLHMESLARQLNKRDVRNALKSLPKELNATYDHAMERIRSQDAGSARLAERVLAWIFNVRRPFSVKELQHALAIRPGDVRASRVPSGKRLC